MRKKITHQRRGVDRDHAWRCVSPKDDFLLVHCLHHNRDESCLRIDATCLIKFLSLPCDSSASLVNSLCGRIGKLKLFGKKEREERERERIAQANATRRSRERASTRAEG